MAIDATIGKSTGIRRARGLQRVGLVIAAAGLGLAAGFGITRSTGEAPRPATHYRTLLLEDTGPVPEYAIFLVRDQAQAEMLDGQFSAAMTYENGATYHRIVIAGTPQEQARAGAMMQQALDAGTVFEVVDMRDRYDP